MARDSDPPKEELKCWAMLHQYGQLVKRLNFQEERVEELRASMYGTGAVKYDGMPRSSSNGSSRQERLLIRLEEMQEKLDELANEEGETYDRIASLLDYLPPDEEHLISMRYLDGKRWNAVSRALYGDEDDFDECEDKYLKKTFKKHTRALHDLEGVLEAEGLSDTQDRPGSQP